MTPQQHADELLQTYQANRHLPKCQRLPSDPLLNVNIKIPASLHQRLRDHARATKSSVSKLCRDGAIREMNAASDAAR